LTAGRSFLENSPVFRHILPMWLIGRIGFLIFRSNTPIRVAVMVLVFAFPLIIAWGCGTGFPV
jgi:hypothetical protein